MDENTMNQVTEAAVNNGFDFGSGLIGFGAGIISTIAVGGLIKITKKIAPKKAIEVQVTEETTEEE